MRIASIVWLAGIALLVARAPAAACTGDCNNNGQVTVSELISAVNIALQTRPASDCTPADVDGNSEVTIGELIAAVNNALGSCPAASPTPTPSLTGTATSTATETPTATPTIDVNDPPVVPTFGIYVTYPGMPIRIPLGVTDPDGDPITFAATFLPEGATLDPATGVFEWTPREDQIGPFIPTFTATDSATPNNNTNGKLPIQVYPPDPCVIAECDPPTGCTLTQRPITEDCCTPGVEPLRVPEVTADCPAGINLFVGRNLARGTFGRIANCSKMRVVEAPQVGRIFYTNVEVRCMSPAQFSLDAKLETAQDVLLSQFLTIPILTFRPDRYAEYHSLDLMATRDVSADRFEGKEAILTIVGLDSNGLERTVQRRVVLTIESVEDLPDLTLPPAN